MTKRKWCDMVWGLLANDPRNSVERIDYTDGPGAYGTFWRGFRKEQKEEA